MFGLLRYGVKKLAAIGLRQNFSNLGDMTGKTYDEIVAAVGTPNSVSYQSGGRKLCQWLESGYHVAILFDCNNIFEGITHESSF